MLFSRRRRRIIERSIAVLALLLLVGAVGRSGLAQAQMHDHESLPPELAEPMPYLPDALAARHPDDLDAASLYAEALFLLIPRRGYRDITDPDVVRLLEVLEGVLAKDLRHPGACHLYVHATEATTEPGRAEACAEYLGDSIPGASHINHMPSHTWNEIGRWGDSVRANVAAWHSDQKAAVGAGVPIYPPHNLHMLLFAASYDGQGAVATQAGKDHAKLTGDNVYRALTLLRFGRFDEILELPERPAGNDFSAGMWNFAQGYARLRTGEADFARVYLERLQQIAESTDAMYRFDPVERLLNVVKEILAGEIHWHDGDRRAAVAAFERAVTHEDALEYDEPEPLPFAARHWLGAALLETERHRDAERVYREELEDHPHNGWSLFGLQTALVAQGKSTEGVDEDLAQSWARADVWLKSSRF
jgi:tetratricopeptide (TPR) repeat protein